VLVEHGRAVLGRLARAEHDLADVVALRAGHVAIRAFPTRSSTSSRVRSTACSAERQPFT
jgi:hypothetical protein